METRKSNNSHERNLQGEHVSRRAYFSDGPWYDAKQPRVYVYSALQQPTRLQRSCVKSVALHI